MMKKLFLGCSLLAMLLVVSCQKEQTPLVVEQGYGLVELAANTSSEVLTRAEVDFTVPEVSEFSLEIQGTEYNQKWELFSDFVSADNKLQVGDYTASIAWGDPFVEGENSPAYVGSTTFTIHSQQVTQASIVAKLANAQVRVAFTEQFKSYFHDAEITLKTASGGEFTFTPESLPTIFVAPLEFSLSGKAFKQNGTEVSFPERSIEAKPQYRYTYTYDMSSAGTATVTIRLDDTVVEQIIIDEELNPEA